MANFEIMNHPGWVRVCGTLGWTLVMVWLLILTISLTLTVGNPYAEKQEEEHEHLEADEGYPIRQTGFLNVTLYYRTPEQRERLCRNQAHSEEGGGTSNVLKSPGLIKRCPAFSWSETTLLRNVIQEMTPQRGGESFRVQSVQRLTGECKVEFYMFRAYSVLDLNSGRKYILVTGLLGQGQVGYLNDVTQCYLWSQSDFSPVVWKAVAAETLGETQNGYQPVKLICEGSQSRNSRTHKNNTSHKNVKNSDLQFKYVSLNLHKNCALPSNIISIQKSKEINPVNKRIKPHRKTICARYPEFVNNTKGKLDIWAKYYKFFGINDIHLYPSPRTQHDLSRSPRAGDLGEKLDRDLVTFHDSTWWDLLKSQLKYTHVYVDISSSHNTHMTALYRFDCRLWAHPESTLLDML